MSRKLHKPVLETKGLLVPLSQGGTNAPTAVLADISLDLVTTGMLNAANGIAGLDANGDILTSQIPSGLVLESLKVDGPSLVFTSSTNVWTITDYDQYSTYTISASVGFVARAADKIYYTAPGTAGAAGFTVNGKAINVTASARYVAKPSIVAPTPNLNTVGNSLNITASDFTVKGGFPETLLMASDATASDQLGQFLTICKDGSRIFVGSWYNTRGGLTNRGALYVYVNNAGVWTQEAKIVPADTVAGDYFGSCPSTDLTGSRIAIGCHRSDPAGLTDAGAVYIYTRSGSTWTQEQKLTAADKATVDLFGYCTSLTDDGTRLIASCHQSSSTDSGAAYIFLRTGTSWAQEAKLVGSNTAAGDNFGTSVSITSDGSRVAIGSPLYDGGVTDAGAVYVFGRSGVTWTQEQGITAPTGDRITNDQFGYISQISRDGTRLFVSAYLADVNGAVDAGAVYVFSRSGVTWTQEAKLIANDNQPGNKFGFGLSLNSTNDRILIGAYAATVGGITNAGAVYTFVRIGTTWTQESKYVSPSLNVGGLFGTAVGLSDNSQYMMITESGYSIDANSNNVGRIHIVNSDFLASTDWQLSTDATFATILTQSLADATNRKSWSVGNLALNTDYYIRCRYNGTQYGTSEWSDVTHFSTRQSWLPINEQQIITASDKEVNGYFGNGARNISISSDGTRLVIGSNYKDAGGLADSGAVYVYTRTGGTWVQEAILTASDKAAGDFFGFATAVTANSDRIAVSAWYASPSGITQAGAVYIFSRSGTVWTQEQKITASDKVTLDYFGSSLAIDSTGTRIVIGAFYKDVPTNNEGQVYVYSRSGTTWTEEQKLTASDRAQVDEFGVSCDISQDGTRIVVGAFFADITGSADAGAAYVFSRSGTVWTQEQKITASDKAVSDYFGYRVVFDATATRVIISAYNKTVGGVANCGQVYVFLRTGTTWAQEALLSASDKTANDWFGSNISVNADGSMVAIGVNAKTVAGVTNAGKAYLFTRLGPNWIEAASISASDKAASDLFGNMICLAFDASQLFISAYARNSGGLVDSGAVYVFN